MTSRKLDELASNIDDAATVVEELQVEPDADTDEKLDELHDILEHASDRIDEIGDREEKEEARSIVDSPKKA
jgi:hypothetical protein